MRAICLVDTRNHAQFIDECVRSCLAQEVPPGWAYAVHVVDAGSTDGTVQALRAYGDQITLHQRENIGQSGAFDLCLALEADIFVFCDGDDRLRLNRLRRVLEVFDAHPEVILVGNAITEVDGAGEPTREVFVGEDQYLDARTEPDAGRLYSARCLMGTSRLAVRKAPLVRILPFERVVLFEADEFLFNVLPALGRVCILSERLTDYRLHSDNNYQNAHLSLEKITRYRLVHEALRACMQGIYSKLELDGPYVTLSASAVEEHCQAIKLYEEALLSRKKALNLVLGSPHILGFVNPSLAKRLAFTLPVLAFGLRPSLLAMARLRRLGSRRGFHSERLL
jgi:glycosyltransferase involved in cell wall biosynthesis